MSAFCFNVGQVLFRAVLEGTSVRYEEHRVVRVTPRGGWTVPEPRNFSSLSAAGRPERFALCGARWCSPTREEALARLRARSASYVRHCRRRLAEAERRCAAVGEILPAEALFLGSRWED